MDVPEVAGTLFEGSLSDNCLFYQGYTLFDCFHVELTVPGSGLVEPSIHTTGISTPILAVSDYVLLDVYLILCQM